MCERLVEVKLSWNSFELYQLLIRHIRNTNHKRWSTTKYFFKNHEVSSSNLGFYHTFTHGCQHVHSQIREVSNFKPPIHVRSSMVVSHWILHNWSWLVISTISKREKKHKELQQSYQFMMVFLSLVHGYSALPKCSEIQLINMKHEYVNQFMDDFHSTKTHRDFPKTLPQFSRKAHFHG